MKTLSEKTAVNLLLTKQCRPGCYTYYNRNYQIVSTGKSYIVYRFDPDWAVYECFCVIPEYRFRHC